MTVATRKGGSQKKRPEKGSFFEAEKRDAQQLCFTLFGLILECLFRGAVFYDSMNLKCFCKTQCTVLIKVL